GAAVFIATFGAAAQQPSTRTRVRVETLASDKFEGRLAGSNGERLAADYIASQLESFGASPLPGRGDFFMPFEFTAGTRDGGSSIELRGTTTAPVDGMPGGVDWGLVSGAVASGQT